ncbi:hypothetical protein I302_101220 [Kwoniella bestiolae CBS 10118]|uniref:MARVEL domain-containing protein n=1 Tax=Kwoniella bestiolae CBS 10118 TaxID=1296100 RepID=A0A1B9G7B2_9TREE|nr:hypothetical protein I302_04593 [Kwoniella bestiolae CBS 10118]OCF26902.1 hypothetical protein I302_04593 [Kwoniella bestiolae CBS 10118]
MSSYSAGPKIRYAFFAVSTLIFLLAFILNLAAPGFGYGGIGFVSLWIHVAIGVIMLIYYPPAIYLALKDRRTTFDQAGGEVAVGVLITLSWLASAITQLIWSAWDVCNDTDSGYYSKKSGCAASGIVLVVLYILGLIVHFAWTSWIIRLVHRNSSSKKERDAVYKISAHQLVKGDVENSKVSGMGDEEGLYNHRL